MEGGNCKISSETGTLLQMCALCATSKFQVLKVQSSVLLVGLAGLQEEGGGRINMQLLLAKMHLIGVCAVCCVCCVCCVYSSVECQKADWGLGHKSLCKTLRDGGTPQDQCELSFLHSLPPQKQTKRKMKHLWAKQARIE